MEIEKIIDLGRKNYDFLANSEKIELDQVLNVNETGDAFKRKLMSRIMAAANVIGQTGIHKDTYILKCEMGSHLFDVIKDSLYSMTIDENKVKLAGITIERNDKVNDGYIAVYYAGDEDDVIDDNNYHNYYTFHIKEVTY